MRKIILLICATIWVSSIMSAQDGGLLDLIEDEPEKEYSEASYKTTRVINLQSVENVGDGVLDIKISHRFGFLNGGIYELFGLDQASIRIGADYGVNERLMVGFGRSSFEKTYDAFAKYRILRQIERGGHMPISLSYSGSAAVKTIRLTGPEAELPGSSRWYYTHQLILGRKFSEGLSLQISPTVVHRNIVAKATEKNDVWAIPIAGRIKLTKRTTLNAEYIYLPAGQVADGIFNSLSIGFDIETGGHVFQLHFSNSTSMIEKGFITETVGDWTDGDIHFGFNISRVF